ncbi:hypothetical protein AAFF_G00422570 [Aldrovandia affinis]|uniref:Uncharacterized protein n=1 Tax=Aldrovandia affinis TaxID=143900 RepID=A0AAD7T6L4_9TELE|nr:hypothetical protein AAFF_G00422570 [Aldrovandia affinis]
MKTEPMTDSTEYTPLDLRSDVKRREDIEQRVGSETECGMSREEKYILSNIKEEEEEEEGGEWQDEEMKVCVRDDEVNRLWREQKTERDEQREIDEIDQTSQTDREVKNGGKSDHIKQEVEDLSPSVTSCRLKQHKEPNHHPLEMTDISVPEFPSPHPVAGNEDQGVSSPWNQDELLPVGQKGKVMTWKRKMIDSSKSSKKQLPDSSDRNTSAEPSVASPDICPMNENTGQSIERPSLLPKRTHTAGVERSEPAARFAARERRRNSERPPW